MFMWQSCSLWKTRKVWDCYHNLLKNIIECPKCLTKWFFGYEWRKYIYVRRSREFFVDEKIL